MGSETLPCNCYTFSEEYNIAFYSTSTGYWYSSFNFKVHIIAIYSHCL